VKKLINFTEAMLETHLADLGITDGNNIVVHAKLLSFGLMVSKNVPEMVTNKLLNLIGSSGTLIYPSFILNDAASVYDPLLTKTSGVGMLGEYLRNEPNTIRSLCPIHNHVGYGELANILLESNFENSLGPNSDFDILLKNDFKLVLLGCNFNEGCTFAHHMEAVMNVDYRHWIQTKKLVNFQNNKRKVIEANVNYFARNTINYEQDFHKLQKDLKEEDMLKVISLPYGESSIIRLHDLAIFIKKKVELDPYYLVKRVECTQ
jgi:aminoglycoside 3-N-acetyltransferase